MEQLLTTFLTWQFLLFCFALAAIIEVIRRFVEYFEKDVKDLLLWRKLILPIAPVFLGSAFGLLVKGYPYPEGVSSSGARFFFGLAAGLLSGWIYRAFKAFIKGFIKTKDDSGTNLENCTVESVRETIRKEPVIPNVEENKTDF